MGGTVGHIKHLYEDYKFTHDSMAALLDSIVNDSKHIVFYEKLDGMQLSFQINENNTLSFARSEKDIKNNGLTKATLFEKFQKFPNAQRAMFEAAECLEKAVNNLTYSKAFEGWHSTEIIYPANANVIHYSKNAIALHGITHTNTGVINTNQTLATYLRPEVEKNGWSLISKMELKFPRINRTQELTNLKDKISNWFVHMSVQDGETIRDFLIRELTNKALTFINNMYAAQTLAWIASGGAYSLAKLKKEIRVSNTTNLTVLVEKLEKYRDELLYSYKELIQHFAQELLSQLKSKLIEQPEHESNRINERVAIAINSLKPQQFAAVEKHVRALEAYPKSSKTMLEGVVFEWNDEIYKLTGRFAHINQILGCERYSRS